MSIHQQNVQLSRIGLTPWQVCIGLARAIRLPLKPAQMALFGVLSQLVLDKHLVPCRKLWNRSVQTKAHGPVSAFWSLLTSPVHQLLPVPLPGHLEQRVGMREVVRAKSLMFGYKICYRRLATFKWLICSGGCFSRSKK